MPAEPTDPIATGTGPEVEIGDIEFLHTERTEIVILGIEWVFELWPFGRGLVLDHHELMVGGVGDDLESIEFRGDEAKPSKPD